MSYTLLCYILNRSYICLLSQTSFTSTDVTEDQRPASRHHHNNQYYGEPRQPSLTSGYSSQESMTSSSSLRLRGLVRLFRQRVGSLCADVSCVYGADGLMPAYTYVTLDESE